MKKRLSIKNRLVRSFGSVLVIGILLNSLVASYFSKEYIAEKTKSELNKMAINYADKVDIILRDKAEEIRTLCEIPYLKEDKVTIENKLMLLYKLNQYMSFQDLVIIDIQGNSYGAQDLKFSKVAYEEYKKALKGETIISNVIEADGETLFVIAAPIKNESNEIIGALIGLESLKSFYNTLKQSGIAEEIFILDKKAEMVCHFNDRILKNSLTLKEMQEDENYQDLYHIYEDMIKGNKNIKRYRNATNGEIVYLSYAPINNGWSLAIVNYESALTRPVKIFTYILLFSSIVISILGIIIVYFISKNLSVKLSEIADCIHFVAAGDFKHPIPKEFLELQDEMGDTARAVDEIRTEVEGMLVDIRRCTNYMNEQMEELTSEIKDSLKNAVAVHEMASENMEDVTARINNIHSITEYVQNPMKNSHK